MSRALADIIVISRIGADAFDELQAAFDQALAYVPESEKPRVQSKFDANAILVRFSMASAKKLATDLFSRGTEGT